MLPGEQLADFPRAFVSLKHALISAPILAFPNLNHDFILDTDGLGVVLSQQSAEGEKVIIYASPNPD